MFFDKSWMLDVILCTSKNVEAYHCFSGISELFTIAKTVNRIRVKSSETKERESKIKTINFRKVGSSKLREMSVKNLWKASSWGKEV